MQQVSKCLILDSKYGSNAACEVPNPYWAHVGTNVQVLSFVGGIYYIGRDDDFSSACFNDFMLSVGQCFNRNFVIMMTMMIRFITLWG